VHEQQQQQQVAQLQGLDTSAAAAAVLHCTVQTQRPADFQLQLIRLQLVG
jgi:hypothetical protein